MRVLAPAIIAAIVTVLSVAVNLIVAISTLRRTRAENHASRRYQETFLMVPRKLEALEEVWAGLFMIQAAGHLSDEELQRLVRASIWLPSKIRNEVLAIITRSVRDGEALPPQQFEAVREALLQAIRAPQMEALLNALEG